MPSRPSTTGTRRATLDDKKKLIDSVDCFIFDCDGGLGGVLPLGGAALAALLLWVCEVHGGDAQAQDSVACRLSLSTAMALLHT